MNEVQNFRQDVKLESTYLRFEVISSMYFLHFFLISDRDSPNMPKGVLGSRTSSDD
jgi:hypothetical protein